MFKIALTTALLAFATAGLAQSPADPVAGGQSFDAWAEHARSRMTALDANHDGRIDQQEFAARAAMMGRHHQPDAAMTDAAAPSHDGSRMFARFDANKDGVLDTAEINAMLARRFARMDANHDGVLSSDERHAMRGMRMAEQ